MRGNGCARRLSSSAISGSTRRTAQSCSRASPVISSCGRSETSSNSVCSWDGASRHHKSGASTGPQRPRWSTCFASRIATRSRLRSPIGCARRTNCQTCWQRGRHRSAEEGRNKGPRNARRWQLERVLRRSRQRESEDVAVDRHRSVVHGLHSHDRVVYLDAGLRIAGRFRSLVLLSDASLAHIA